MTSMLWLTGGSIVTIVLAAAAWWRARQAAQNAVLALEAANLAIIRANTALATVASMRRAANRRPGAPNGIEREMAAS